MSMRGSGGEENCPAPPTGAEVSVPGETSRHSASPAIDMTAIRCEVSPLLSVFTSKEIVPTILEYEKAVLVMKEHDYAKAGERPEVLKLSSLLTEMPPTREESREPVDPLGDINTLLNSRKELLQFRKQFGKREDSAVSDHLREVVGMQIELIREQQEQLHEKDKELSTVRKDKEQLQARLERMERRLAISQRNSKASRYDTGEFDPANNLSANENSASLLDSVASSLTPRMRRHRDSVAGSDKHERSRSSSKDRVCKTGRSSRVSSHSGTPIPAELNESSLTAVGKRNAKRKLSENLPVESSSRKKRPKQVEIRTRVEYEGLNLPPPRTPRDWGDGGCLPCGERPTAVAAATTTNHFVNSRQNSADLANSVPSPCMSSSGHSGEVSNSEGKATVLNGTDATSATTTILVPSWRTVVVKTNIELDPIIIEDVTDESFLKRHRKPEEDEKRRKRWDLQRTRTLRNHEELLRKYNQKGGGGEKPEKKKEKVVSLLPKLSEVESLEIKDTLPVSAFGVPLPQIKSREFQLPWFDLDAREARENARTTRSKARASTSRLSVGSSADEDFK